MIDLQIISSLGTLACTVLLAGFGAASFWAARQDQADLHLAHRPGSCPSGDCDQP